MMNIARNDMKRVQMNERKRVNGNDVERERVAIWATPDYEKS